ncbi:MAG TPA: DUF456 domain-containing protein, partial [Syntrophomonas sp.]|nr:DUF456 domain-containing protein [Syntrophomonas sp.]
IVVILLLLAGMAGTVVPFIPGIPLMFIGIAAYGWYDNFQTIDAQYLIVLACLTLLSVFMDYLSPMLGAKYFGSTKQGTWGALLGTVIGLFLFPPIGIIAGPFVGAIIGESMAGKDSRAALKVALGTVAGLFTGMLFNVILAIGMVLSFIIKLI